MALAIDGQVHTNSGGSASLAVSLTTTLTNDYIIVCITTNGAPVTSVTSAHLTFSFIVAVDAVGQDIEFWAAFSTGALSSESITINTTTSAFLTIDAFGVSGSGQTSLVFDSGGPQTGIVDPVSITTVNANTMVIAGLRQSTFAAEPAGSGFSTLNTADFQLVEYKVLTSAQTLSCTQNNPGTANGVLVIAIVQATGFTWSMMDEESAAIAKGHWRRDMIRHD
jgi:hypothetical protein